MRASPSVALLPLAALAGVVAAVASPALTVLLAVVLAVAISLLLPARRDAPTLWWMHPAWAMLIAVAPGLGIALSLDNEGFIEQFGAPKHIDPAVVWLIAGLAGVFALASYLAADSGRWPGGGTSLDAVPEATVARLVRVARWLFWITLVGYGLWTAIAVARGLRPADIASIVSGTGNTDALKDAYLAPVAGITTLSQFGPLAIVALIVAGRLDRRFPAVRYLVALGVLSFARAFVYSERLAIVELAIPAVLVAIALSSRAGRRRGWLRLLPLWAPIVLVLFFGSFEYVRSWNRHYKQFGDNYASFTVQRLGAYYATALNNGAGWLEQPDPRLNGVPYHVLAAFWNLPGVSVALPYERAAGTSFADPYEDFLRSQANPEFNNPSGLLIAVWDLGRPLGFVFWAFAGAFVGWAYGMFRRRELQGLLLYPVLMIGVLEAGRILYWTSGSAFPSLAGALILCHYVAGARSRRPAARRAGPHALSPPLAEP